MVVELWRCWDREEGGGRKGVVAEEAMLIEVCIIFYLVGFLSRK